MAAKRDRRKAKAAEAAATASAMDAARQDELQKRAVEDQRRLEEDRRRAEEDRLWKESEVAKGKLLGRVQGSVSGGEREYECECEW